MSDKLVVTLVFDGKIVRYQAPITLTLEQIRDAHKAPVELLPPPGKGFCYRAADADVTRFEVVPVDEKKPA